MGEIDSATQERTLSLDQIGRAITQIDDVTQQNAALVEEAAAAASALHVQACDLTRAVSTFKLN
jgi:methyl-accepting chemotaxis protein